VARGGDCVTLKCQVTISYSREIERGDIEAGLTPLGVYPDPMNQVMHEGSNKRYLSLESQITSCNCAGHGLHRRVDLDIVVAVICIREHQLIQLKRNRISQASLITEATEVPLLRKVVRRHSQAVRLNTFLPISYFDPSKHTNEVINTFFNLKNDLRDTSAEPTDHSVLNKHLATVPTEYKPWCYLTQCRHRRANNNRLPTTCNHSHKK
jgi:hypothetical protein